MSRIASRSRRCVTLRDTYVACFVFVVIGYAARLQGPGHLGAWARECVLEPQACCFIYHCCCYCFCFCCHLVSSIAVQAICVSATAMPSPGASLLVCSPSPAPSSCLRTACIFALHSSVHGRQAARAVLTCPACRFGAFAGAAGS